MDGWCVRRWSSYFLVVVEFTVALLIVSSQSGLSPLTSYINTFLFCFFLYITPLYSIL